MNPIIPAGPASVSSDRREKWVAIALIEEWATEMRNKKTEQTQN